MNYLNIISDGLLEYAYVQTGHKNDKIINTLPTKLQY